MASNLCFSFAWASGGCLLSQLENDGSVIFLFSLVFRANRFSQFFIDGVLVVFFG